MIRHIVMFRFQESAQGRSREQNVALSKQKLEALPPVISQIRSFDVRLNCNFNGVNCDLALIADYDNLDDLEAYRVHPAHVAVGAFMKETTELRASVDYEV